MLGPILYCTSIATFYIHRYIFLTPTKELKRIGSEFSIGLSRSNSLIITSIADLGQLCSTGQFMTDIFKLLGVGCFLLMLASHDREKKKP